MNIAQVGSRPSTVNGHGALTKENPNPENQLQNQMDAIIDQSLFGLLCVALLGVVILINRIFQYDLNLIVLIQLIICCTLCVCLYFRQYIATDLLHIAIVGFMIIIATLSMIRFGLMAPVLVVATVLPIIVGIVRGVKTAVVFTALVMLSIIIVGGLYSTGSFQVSENLQNYLQDPQNWVTYTVLYGGMVMWASALTAKLVEYWLASVRDLKKAEDANLQEREVIAALQRQQSLVQLSGGVAHDFNNILAAITINLELARQLKDEKHQKEVVDEALKDALDATEKGAKLTSSLLAFSKQAVLEPNVVSINKVIAQSISWIVRTIPANIEIELKLGDDLPFVFIDEASLSSAMLNLLINSRDAMPAGGKIEIETRATEIRLDDKNPCGTRLNPGRYVEMIVRDTGTGIPDAEQELVFEPFYSTKAPSEGSGLGLAMVQGFMTQSGGTIYLSSRAGSGTVFKLFFPVRSQQEPEVESHSPSQSTLEPSGASLLVVEDEISILKSLKTMLSACGYKVQTANSGMQAWQLLQENPDVDLVLSDIVMPGAIQGTDLARRIQDANLKPPVLLMSGHAFKHRHDLKLPVVTRLLSKPIRQAELIEAVESSLISKTRGAGHGTGDGTNHGTNQGAEPRIEVSA